MIHALRTRLLTMRSVDRVDTKQYLQFGTTLPGFVPAKMPYQRSSVMKDVALSTAPRYTPGPRLGGRG